MCQLAAIIDSHLISTSIRADLLRLDEYNAYCVVQATEINDIDRRTEEDIDLLLPTTNHISVGSKLATLSLQKIGVQSLSNPIFASFQRKVTERLNLILDMDEPLHLQDTHEVRKLYAFLLCNHDLHNLLLVDYSISICSRNI